MRSLNLTTKEYAAFARADQGVLAAHRCVAAFTACIAGLCRSFSVTAARCIYKRRRLPWNMAAPHYIFLPL
jgi:hypothetical protein